MRILWILPPGFLIGMLAFEYTRRAFSDDPTLVRRIFADQPVTMTAAATIVGSIVVWGILRAVGIW